MQILINEIDPVSIRNELKIECGKFIKGNSFSYPLQSGWIQRNHKLLPFMVITWNDAYDIMEIYTKQRLQFNCNFETAKLIATIFNVLAPDLDCRYAGRHAILKRLLPIYNAFKTNDINLVIKLIKVDSGFLHSLTGA